MGDGKRWVHGRFPPTTRVKISVVLTHEELGHVLDDSHVVGQSSVVLVCQHGAHLAHRHLLIH